MSAAEVLKTQISKLESDLECLRRALEIVGGHSPNGSSDVASAKIRTPATNAAVEPPAGKVEAPRALVSGGDESQSSRILKALKSGPLTAQQIAERTGIRSETVHVAMAKVKEAGYVDKTSAERGSPYKLTPAGIEAARSL